MSRLPHVIKRGERRALHLSVVPVHVGTGRQPGDLGVVVVVPAARRSLTISRHLRGGGGSRRPVGAVAGRCGGDGGGRHGRAGRGREVGVQPGMARRLLQQ